MPAGKAPALDVKRPAVGVEHRFVHGFRDGRVREDGVRKVIAGVTTPGEVLHATVSDSI